MGDQTRDSFFFGIFWSLIWIPIYSQECEIFYGTSNKNFLRKRVPRWNKYKFEFFDIISHLRGEQSLGYCFWSTHPSKMLDSVIALLATPSSKRGRYQRITTPHEDHSPSFVELLSQPLSILCPLWLSAILLLQGNSGTSFICGTSQSLIEHSLPPSTFHGTFIAREFSCNFQFWNL